jgi:hypothetical protein
VADSSAQPSVEHPQGHTVFFVLTTKCGLIIYYKGRIGDRSDETFPKRKHDHHLQIYSTETQLHPTADSKPNETQLGYRFHDDE